MSTSELFIRRPVATTLTMLAVVAFGILAFLRLPVSALPNVDFPTILVSAQLPGASAETMAASVATPLEREFSTIDGVDSMTSTNSLGSTQVTLQFAGSKDLDAAAQDVQAAISRASRRLPTDMPNPPNYRKVNPADQPIIYLSLSSSVLPLYEVDEFAETRLAQRISTITGVAQVQVYGAQKYAVRIQVDPEQLATRGIGFDTVASAIQGANSNIPAGTVYGSSKAYTVDTNGQLLKAADYRSVIVTYRDGSPVRIEDIGRAIDSVENDKTSAWTITSEGEQRSVVLAVQKQPGANTVDVSQAIRSLLPEFRSQLPGAVRLEVLFDRSVSVEESVHDVELTLLLTLALVVLVISLFLRRLAITIIPSLAMPLSIIGTFSVMYLLGYSLNNLTLMALTLSVGFVVDDAIVMLENIVRHVEMGKPKLRAALDGSKEIGFTIVSMTLSLVAVFVPFLFMGGILGRLFREFAVSIAAAILVSGFVSISLTPMLASRFIPQHRAKDSRIGQALEHGFERITALYGRTLGGVLRHRVWTLLFSAAILAGTVALYRAMPKGFLPTEDQGQVFAATEAVEGISFAAVEKRQQQLNEVLKKDPNVDAFMSSVGTRGTIGTSNTGFIFMRLKPKEERTLELPALLAKLRAELNQVPGMRSFLQIPPPIRIGGTLTKSEYQLSLQGPEPEELYELTPKLIDELRKLPEIRDVTSDLQLKNAELRVRIDRDRASALGVSAAQVEDALYSAYGSRQVSTILAPEDSYAVILEVLPEKQRDPTAIERLYVTSSTGKAVPLNAIARIDTGVGPLSVNHIGQLPAVTVSFNLAPNFGLSQATSAVERVAARVLPAHVTTEFQGAAEAFGESLSGLGLLLIVAIFVIYVVLGILYESFIHPITILSALPFAGFGALLTLYLFGMDLNVYAFVGVILLVGLVKKNGIMMVDFAIEAERTGKTALEAIHEASVVRFRPITMTTLAALFGTLPIALGLGAGSESRQPLGLAVVGGLLFSQLLTLYATPVFYVYFDRLRNVKVRRRATKPDDVADGVASHGV